VPGPELFGRYRAVRLLGAGAFASVWLARDDRLDGPVAVKVLADNWAARGDVRERFVDEARMLRRADSDRVVRVHDIGELADGRPYFVMTHADRGTLADRLTDRPMAPAAALWIAGETARAVAVLHARGIIHRDVKPSNVLFRSTEPAGPETSGAASEEVLISDLGLAKAAAVASGITMASGTPGYMAPEQATGIGLTRACDVYALGALTHRLLVGRLPTPAELASPAQPAELASPAQPTPAELASPAARDSTATRAASAWPGLEAVEGLPPAVRAVVRRALSRDPADRQSDARTFARELAAAADPVGQIDPADPVGQISQVSPVGQADAGSGPAAGSGDGGSGDGGSGDGRSSDADGGHADGGARWTAWAPDGPLDPEPDSTATVLTVPRSTGPWCRAPTPAVAGAPVGATALAPPATVSASTGTRGALRRVPAATSGSRPQRAADAARLPAGHGGHADADADAEAGARVEAADDRRPRSRRSRPARGRLVGLWVAAALVVAVAVVATVRPHLLPDLRAVAGGSRVVRQGPVEVTVPAGWSQRSAGSTALPGNAQVVSALTVAPDIAAHGSAASSTPGVYLGLVAGNRAAALDAALAYPHCARASSEPRTVSGWSGTSTLRRCGSAVAGTTSVLTWIGADPATARTLLVEVKVPDRDDALAGRVLSSVRVAAGPA